MVPGLRVESGTGIPELLGPHVVEMDFDLRLECLQQATPMIQQERASARERARARERERARAKQRGMEKREKGIKESERR